MRGITLVLINERSLGLFDVRFMAKDLLGLSTILVNRIAQVRLHVVPDAVDDTAGRQHILDAFVSTTKEMLRRSGIVHVESWDLFWS